MLSELREEVKDQDKEIALLNDYSISLKYLLEASWKETGQVRHPSYDLSLIIIISIVVDVINIMIIIIVFSVVIVAIIIIVVIIIIIITHASEFL